MRHRTTQQVLEADSFLAGMLPYFIAGGKNVGLNNRVLPKKSRDTGASAAVVDGYALAMQQNTATRPRNLRFPVCMSRSCHGSDILCAMTRVWTLVACQPCTKTAMVVYNTNSQRDNNLLEGRLVLPASNLVTHGQHCQHERSACTSRHAG